METKGCKDTFFSNSTAPILISVTKIAEYPVSNQAKPDMKYRTYKIAGYSTNSVPTGTSFRVNI